MDSDTARALMRFHVWLGHIIAATMVQYARDVTSHFSTARIIAKAGVIMKPGDAAGHMLTPDEIAHLTKLREQRR